MAGRRDPLAAAFWPGPMTLIVKRASHVCLMPSLAGRTLLDCACPSRPAAQSLLREFMRLMLGMRPWRGAVRQSVWPGRPTTAQHVAEEFPQQALLVLDGGAPAKLA